MCIISQTQKTQLYRPCSSRYTFDIYRQQRRPAAGRTCSWESFKVSFQFLLKSASIYAKKKRIFETTFKYFLHLVGFPQEATFCSQRLQIVLVLLLLQFKITHEYDFVDVRGSLGQFTIAFVRYKINDEGDFVDMRGLIVYSPS